MDRRHKDALLRNRLTLVRDLIVNDELLAVLRAGKIISEELQEQIENKPTAQGKASCLLDILPRHGKKAFGQFIKALDETQQKHLITLLCPDEDGGHTAGADLDFTDLDNDYWKKSLVTMKEEIESPKTDLMKIKVHPMTEGLRSKLRQQLDVYTIHSERKKLAFIINNKYFSKFPPRDGSENDIVNFSNLFEQLNFTVIKKSDLDAKDMKQELESVRDQLKSGLYDVFVCCIMSHGAKGVVYSHDEKGLNIQNDILGCFSDQNCPEMTGKPKLFFIQACQNDNTKNPKPEDSTDAHPAINESVNTIWNNPDILLVLATAEGFKAYRHPELGSFFIRAIVYVFSNRACKDHLSDLLTQVCNILSCFLTKEKYSQVAERRDSLSKKMYFLA